jgi:hypothetical protein
LILNLSSHILFFSLLFSTLTFCFLLVP